MTGKVYLIGAGPGDPELLTVRALSVLKGADAVVYDRLVSREILALAPSGCRLVNVGKKPRHHSVPQDRINEILIDLAGEGLTVARLKGGDPLIFGRGGEEAAALVEAGIAVDYVPGITAAQGAAAATGIPLTHRNLATGFRFVTGHRAGDEPLDLDWAGLANERTTLVVYMGVASIGEIADELMAHGLPRHLPVMAIADATTPRERRMRSSLAAIERDVTAHRLTAPALFIIGHVVSLYRDVPACLPADLLLEGARMAAHA